MAPNQNRQRLRTCGIGTPNMTSGTGAVARVPGSTQFFDALGGADNVGHANTELFVNHHHLAMGNQRTVDQNIQRLSGEPVSSINGARVDLQKVRMVIVWRANLLG